MCDDRHSELIPCLDRNLIYQMRLKLDLSLMEHYERHCPPPERRFNCLIPPPPGYKVSFISSTLLVLTRRGGSQNMEGNECSCGAYVLDDSC